MNNVYWLGKGHKVNCECEQCLEPQSTDDMDTKLEEIKERLKFYHFATRMQENDFISLMIMVEKLRGKK